MEVEIPNQQDGVGETLKGSFLTFQVGSETYGIEIRCVKEIIGLQPLTVMPEMPEYIKGIINLRGRVIPAMDVRLRFGMPWKEYDDRTCIIVIEINTISVGLIIDSVSDVTTISDDEIVKKPEMSTRDGGGYVDKIGRKDGHVILLLDHRTLLGTDELDEAFGGLND